MDVSELLLQLHRADPRSIGRAITLVENQDSVSDQILAGLNRDRIEESLVLGITGPPGAGKSTLTAGLVRLLRERGQRIGIVAVDPSSPISGGALLGDRIRMMDHALDPDVVVRSMATRGRLGGLCASAGAAVRILAASGCRKVIIETVGVGQTEMDIIRLADITLMVLAPGFGDDIQAMKAGILEVADLLVVNKADQPGIDKLLLDLAPLFATATEKDLRLVQTIASEGRGLAELLDRLNLMEERYRDDGTLSRRRHSSFTIETVDWAIEMLRPGLEKLVRAEKNGAEPRLAARRILDKMRQERKQ